MPIEFIGSLVSAAPLASGLPSPGEAQDPDYPARTAAVLEESGFDRVLLGHSSDGPDGFVVANQVLTATSRIGVLLAHRPGIVAPTVAARQYATLDAFHPGRIAMHVLTDGADGDHLRDGDVFDSALRRHRTREFLAVVRLAWNSPEPFDHAGEFYQVAGGMSAVRPDSGRVPVYVDAASDGTAGIEAEHADVLAFQGEPVATIAGRIAAIRAAASRCRRRPRFAVRARLIAAATEAAARDRACHVPDAAQASGRDGQPWPGGARPVALVGSYEQVADAVLDYVAVGVSALVICGHNPEADAAGAATIIRLVREQAEGGGRLVA